MTVQDEMLGRARVGSGMLCWFCCVLVLHRHVQRCA